MEVMARTELVELVMNLVEDERLIIVCCVVLDNLIGLKDIHHFDPVKVDHDFTTCPAWNILDFICLESGLSIPDRCKERDHHVKAWTSIAPPL